MSASSGVRARAFSSPRWGKGGSASQVATGSLPGPALPKANAAICQTTWDRAVVSGPWIAQRDLAEVGVLRPP